MHFLTHLSFSPQKLCTGLGGGLWYGAKLQTFLHHLVEAAQLYLPITAANPLNAKPSYFTLFNVLVSQPLQEARLFDGSADSHFRGSFWKKETAI